MRSQHSVEHQLEGCYLLFLHLGDPPSCQGADTARLSIHSRYSPASIPQRGRPSYSAGATQVGRELGGWPRMGIS